jgi:hypothetical protein
MSITDSTLREHLAEVQEALERREYSWEEGLITVNSGQGAIYSTAKAYSYLSNTAALLGAARQAREWSGEAARYYIENIRAARARRDMLPQVTWKDEPQMFARALNHALMSQERELLIQVATEALAMDDSHLHVFAEDHPDSAASFFQMKTQAALALEDDRAAPLSRSLQEHVDRLSDPTQYWERIPVFYQAVVEGDASAAQSAFDDVYDYYAGNDPDTDDPRWYVLETPCALLILARQHGIDISVSSDRLPEVFLREQVPEDNIELDVDVGGTQTMSHVGRFEIEEADDGTPIIAAIMYHSGAGEVHASDIPDREAGRLLSDAWIEAALDEADWREHYDDAPVGAAREAFENGTLLRKLVVLQDRTDGGTFDESLSELPIDKIDLQKGAGLQR